MVPGMEFRPRHRQGENFRIVKAQPRVSDASLYFYFNGVQFDSGAPPPSATFHTCWVQCRHHLKDFSAAFLRHFRHGLPGHCLPAVTKHMVATHGDSQRLYGARFHHILPQKLAIAYAVMHDRKIALHQRI